MRGLAKNCGRVTYHRSSVHGHSMVVELPA